MSGADRQDKKAGYKPRVRKGRSSGLWYGRPRGNSVYAYGFRSWEAALHYALTGDYKAAEQIYYRNRRVSRNQERTER